MAEIRLERVTIPTYTAGSPEPSPLFLERRINQGAMGRVYPYCFIDTIGDEKVDREYEAVFLENEYLKIMVLPELGGRVQMAYDKMAQRHFVYHNSVIKPALIGLLGPWLSGGIEFNWPVHHRPTTVERLDYTIVDNDDGSKTLWVGEQEKLFHLRGALGYTIFPGKAYLKLSAMIFNGTDLPQNFLWWTNIAVRSDGDHEHVFPPDVKAVHFHTRSDAGRYPVMTDTYCGFDFSSGTDISRNENIPFAVSYMATPSKYDFCGAYSHQEHAGILHIADAGVSPGKKLFTWGNSQCDFARGWMRNLTDSDGPYLELMAGVFSDNQPDFAWLSPGEEKRFDSFVLPYRELGVMHNANERAALKCAGDDGHVVLDLYVTERAEDWRVSLKVKGEEVWAQDIAVQPERIWSKQIECASAVSPQDIYVCIKDSHGQVVIDYHSEAEAVEPLPDIAAQVQLPHEIRDNDELFLTGLHIEQYLHATYNPEDYYLEALRRDRTDSRCNLAMGRLLLRRGDFDNALGYLQAAWEKMTRWNFNPYDGEVSYLLGLCREFLGDDDAAYGHYYKSTWNGPWQAMGYLALARLQCKKGDLVRAREFIDNALAINGRNRLARHLLVAVMRKQGREADARQRIEQGLMEDPLDYYLLAERCMLTPQADTMTEFLELTGANDHTFLDLAVAYARMGFYDNAERVLSWLDRPDDPMAPYHRAYYVRHHDPVRAREFLAAAEAMPLTPCFPNRLEDMAVLQYAIETADGYKAHYLLGCLLYDKRQYDRAMDCWQACAQRRPDFATVWRNLAIGNFNKRKDLELAREQMEKAVDLAPDNARLIAELNELYVCLGTAPEKRLAFLREHGELLSCRDDLKLEHVIAANLCHRYADALTLLHEYTFHPWECKEGITGDQYVIAHIALGAESLSRGQTAAALEHFKLGMQLPANLGEEKICSATDNDLKYLAGLAYESQGDHQRARSCYQDALPCDMTIYPALSLATVSRPDYILFRGLALAKLGESAAAASCFHQLIEYGVAHQDDDVRFHFLEIGTVTTTIFDEDLSRRNRAYCLHLQALGQLGLNRLAPARDSWETALRLNPNSGRAVLMRHLLTLGVSGLFG